MPITLTKDDLITLTDGESLADAPSPVFASGLNFDSRALKKDEIFVALKGESMHGHAFLAKAEEQRAGIYLIEDRAVAKNLKEPWRAVLVKDTFAALYALTKAWRNELTYPIAAITGSVGKTTVKELVVSILKQVAPGGYSIKSYNNHTGVPYTISTLSKDDAWGVLEMGMNHAGEIEKLSLLGRPTLAAITTIAPAHIEHLGSLEAIARAKLEIIAGLERGSPLIIDGESQVLLQELEKQKIRDSFKVYSVGSVSSGGVFDATVHKVISHGVEELQVVFDVLGATLEVRLHFGGVHNAKNGAMAALIAKLLVPQITSEQIIRGLEAFRAPEQRLVTHQLAGGRRLIDDSYNANPASMKAAISIVADEIARGKRVGFILGDMFELGAFAEQYHAEIGGVVAALHPAFVIGVGPHAERYVSACKKSGVTAFHVMTPEEGARIATSTDFDILLVKASRGMKLEKAVQLILSHYR
jgi:UDP-N-acetylmuramoyl-tripeptide--D-alanyl-D-alanine ligase